MRATSCLTILCAAFDASVSSGQGPRYAIETVAGADAVRDGRPASRAILNSVYGIAFGPDGKLYIADAGGHRVRAVTPHPASGMPPFNAYTRGEIATFAGIGAAAFSGDGGPANEAHLMAPQGVAIDISGNVYIAGGGRIRKVDRAGIIQTIAGGGTLRDDIEGKPATSVSLLSPYGVALGSRGDVYVSEAMQGGRIYRITPEGTVFTVAGAGTLGPEADGGPAREARLLQPMGLTIDGQGNLFIAETGRYCVRKVAPDGKITTAAGTGTRGFSGDGGPASKAQFLTPTSVVVDRSDNLLVLDSGNAGVRSISPEGTIQSLIAPNQYVSSTYGMTLDNRGDLWFARIYSVETTYEGRPQWVLGESGMSNEELCARESVVLSPFGLTADEYGYTYFGDRNPGLIKAIDSRGWLLTLASGYFAPSLGDGGPLSQARISTPRALLADRGGNLWIGDSYRVRRVNRADSVIQTVVGTGQSGVTGDGGPAIEARIDSMDWIALDSENQLYLSSPSGNRIRKVGSDGRITTIAGNGERGSVGDGGPATAAQVTPRGIALSADGTLYFADTVGRKIRSVSRSGVISTIAGGGTATGDGPATGVDIPTPAALAVTGDGDVLFTTGAAIYKVSRAGWLERIAGSDLPGYSGDGGPAIDAKLNTPLTMWVEPGGTILFADSGNHRIRRLIPLKD